MLTCKEITRQATDYTDSEQSLIQRLQFKMHLFSCTHCRRFIKHFQIVTQLIGQLPASTASEQEVKKVMDHIHNAPK